MLRKDAKNFRSIAHGLLLGLLFTLLPAPGVFAADPEVSTDQNLQGITLSAGAEAVLFPAFDPNIYEYYLSTTHPDFNPFDIQVMSPVSGSHSIFFLPGCAVQNLGQSSNGLTTSYTLRPADFVTFCTNPPQANGAAVIEIRTKSEADVRDGIPQTFDYKYRINLRRPLDTSPVVVTFDGTNDEHDGGERVSSSGLARWVEIPPRGNMTKPEHRFAGWALDEGSTLLPGEIEYVDSNSVFSPRWVVEDMEVDIRFGVRPNSFRVFAWRVDDDFEVEYEKILAEEPADFASLSFAARSSQPYRLTLINPDSTVVSRFSNHASMASGNLNATSTSLMAHPGCVEANSCPLTFSLLVEAWSTDMHESFSISNQIMRPTSSEEVCLTINNWSSPNAGLSEPYCTEPGWVAPWRLDGDDVIYDGQSGFAVFRTTQSFSVREKATFQEGGVDGFADDTPIPLNSDLNLYGQWLTSPRAALSRVTLFGVTYDVVDCTPPGQLDQLRSCLESTLGETTIRIEPFSSEEGDSFALVQDVSTSDLSISASWTTGSAWLRVSTLGTSLVDQDNFDRAPVSGSTHTWTDLGADLCPSGQCAAVYYVDFQIETDFNLNFNTLIFKILRQSPGETLSVSFSLSGGQGAFDTVQEVPRGWMSLPTVQGVTKAGFLPVGWRSPSIDEVFQFDTPVPIVFGGDHFDLVWEPAFTMKFMDGFSSSPMTEFLIATSSPTWQPNLREIPDAAHPLGYSFLGWTLTQSSSVPYVIDGTPISLTSDLTFYPIWDLPAPAPSTPQPVVSSPNLSAGTPAPAVVVPVATEPATVSPSTSSNTASSSPGSNPAPMTSPSASALVSTRSTTLTIGRKNGLTQIEFGLPAKYSGGKATIEVRRWINNRVRYFVIGKATVAKPSSSTLGRAQLDFSFRQALRPTDVVRIKVGKITVMNKRLGS